jgi:hypothetical protein
LPDEVNGANDPSETSVLYDHYLAKLIVEPPFTIAEILCCNSTIAHRRTSTRLREGARERQCCRDIAAAERLRLEEEIMHRLVLVALVYVLLSVAAQAQSWTQVGALMCKVDPSVGFIIVGHQPMQCTYTPSLAPAPPQYYDGAINTLGIDLGVSAGGVLAWGVFSPTTGLSQGALSGEYVGASGDVGLIAGAGANILLGGSARTVALQPLSLQGSLAFNVVLGVSSLKLRPATWR